MPNLKVNGKNFPYPSPQEEPGWGDSATSWASEVTTALDNFAGLGVIQETQAIIENSVLEANKKSVAGLIFNNTLTQSAKIAYRISRETTNTGKVLETGEFDILYTPNDPLNKWKISRTINGGEPALVYFDIDNAGQVKYWASPRLVDVINDSNYIGIIRFKTIGNLK
jgi:hypothetical protein